MRASGLIYLFLSFLMTPAAFAGGGGDVAGNGGDVLVCKDGTVEFFDIFETQAMRRFKVDLGPKDMSPYDKVERALDKIPEQLQDWKRFLRESFLIFKMKHVIGDFELVDIPDANNIVIKPGCEVKQGAIQRSSLLPDDPIFFIDRNYWDLMDNDSRAALILHEILYYDVKTMGHSNSIVVRALNSYLMSDMDELDRFCGIGRIFQSANLLQFMPTIAVNGLVMAGNSKIEKDCKISRGFVVSGDVVVEGTIFKPITKGDATFPNEVGIGGIALKMSGVTSYLAHSQRTVIRIGKHELVTAPVRERDWATTSHWSIYKPEDSVVERRPGFIVRFEEGPSAGQIRTVAVDGMYMELFGNKTYIRGEVEFSEGDRDVIRVDMAGVSPLSILGVDALVSKIRIHEQGGKLYEITFAPGTYYRLTTCDGNGISVMGGMTYMLRPVGCVYEYYRK